MLSLQLQFLYLMGDSLNNEIGKNDYVPQNKIVFGFVLILHSN